MQADSVQHDPISDGIRTVDSGEVRTITTVYQPIEAELIGESLSPLKLPRISAAMSIAECHCIELCCGSAKLSQALRDLGMAVLPIDYKNNRHIPKVRFVSIDLTKPSAYEILGQLLDTGAVKYLHAGPPCGTGSRAREKPISAELKAMGAPEPKPLRSEQYPLGLPHLQGIDLERVRQANAIYSCVAAIVRRCLELELLVSIENPTNAYLWWIPEWKELLQHRQLEPVDHQVCMFGGQRNKWSRWLATRGLLTSLRVECDGKHQHKPWGFTSDALKPGWNFATAEEAEYPTVLCQRVAQLVHAALVAKGFLPLPNSISDPGLTDRQRIKLSRASTGKLPRGRALPPLISEFDRVEEHCTFKQTKDCKLLRQYHKGGANGAQGELVYIVGHYRDPVIFFEEAANCQHPTDILKNVDDYTKRALFNILTYGPEKLETVRREYLEWMRKRAVELEAQEEQLHDNMPEHVKALMRGKKLLLFQEIMLEAGCKDGGLMDLLTQGVELTGTAKASGELHKQIKPVETTDAELRAQAHIQRRATSEDFRCAGNIQTVQQQTDEECAAGWLGGPFTSEQLDDRYGTWISSHRFGIDQGPKTRIIDDCKQSGLNTAFGSTEKLDLMDIDRLAELLKVILLAFSSDDRVRIQLSDGSLLEGKQHEQWKGSPDEGLWFQGRLLDLKSAYKQMAVHTNSLWASNVHVDDPDANRPRYYTSYALLFGATASVYSFNRWARALWRCMTKHLNLLLLQFYDDFPQLEPRQTAPSGRTAATDFLDILGVQWSQGDKDLAFADVFQPLGVQVDLSEFATRAKAVFANKPSRIQALTEQIRKVMTEDKLPPNVASELHGKLQFAQAQIFGKAAMPAIREISNRANENGRPHNLTDRLRRALEFAIFNLTNAKPRSISACDPVNNIVVFTDGAYEDNKGTWGFVIRDCADDSKFVSGGIISQWLIDLWQEMVGQQLIAQVELFAVVVARIFLQPKAVGRKIIYWIDNESAKDSLVKGFSPSAASMALIYQFYECETTGPSMPWFARVPSYSNIADGPSRGEAAKVANELGAKLVAPQIADVLMGRLRKGSLPQTHWGPQRESSS